MSKPSKHYISRLLKLLLPTVLLVAIFMVIAPAYARSRPEPTTGHWSKAYAELGYFQTSANYDASGGSFTALNSGRNYKLVDSRLGFEHRFLPNFSIFSDLGMAYARSFDGSFTRESFTLTEIFAGARWLVFSLPFATTFEMMGFFPFNRVDPNTDNVLTGEGAAGFQGGIWLESLFSDFAPYIYLGGRYQDGGRASHFLGQVGVDWQPERHSFYIGLGLRGHTVIMEDDNTDVPVLRDAVTTRVNGGSMKFYSVNPTEMAAQASFGFNVHPQWLWNFLVDYTINGSRSAQGFTVLTSVTWNINHDETEAIQHIRQRTEVEQFKPLPPDDYDPTLFVEPAPRPKKPKARKAPKKRPQSNSSDDSLLDDVKQSF